ncbi:Adaptor complexe medium subunit family protein [Aphelenchoides besseyi]|nr:Adaptor complexe medium subunit family protein [Aphelenchoides besseyi]
MDHSTFGYANHKADRRRSSNAARIAFRRAASTAGTNEPSVFHDGAEFDMDTLRKEERAIRSFTDSVEFDLPPAPELPASLDPDQYEGYGMRESSTADTIIEVRFLIVDSLIVVKVAKLAAEVDALTNAASERFDRTLGETQKYRMAVPGPEQVDQEFEMHKSLLENAEEEVPTFADPSIATRPSDLRGRSTSIITTVNDRDHQLIRRQYSSSAVQRPRATTPTSWSVIDTFVQQQEKEQQSGTNEMAGKQKRKRLKDGPPPDSGAKIRVSIPTDRRSSGTSGHRSRHNSMSWSDFYESMEQPGSRQVIITFTVNLFKKFSHDPAHFKPWISWISITNGQKPRDNQKLKLFGISNKNTSMQMGYDYGTTGQATGYDYSAGTGTDEQQPGSYDYNAYTGDQTTVAVGGYDAYTSGTYDPLAYNAGYDQYGLQTGVVGAEDTAGSSADASPRPIDPTTNDNAETAGSTTNYDYSQYGNQYESYAANDYQMSSTEPTSQYGTSEADTTVTVNEPDPSLSTQYGTTADYEAYGSAIDTGEIDYNAQYGSMSAVEEPAPIDPTTSVDPTDPINSTSALTSGGLQPFSTPLLPQQRARTPDPFSWEAQETNYDQTGTAQPPRPPRPAPVRTPEPDSETEVPSPQVETEQPVKAIPPPMPPQPSVVKKPVEVEEEDPWARFKQMSEQAMVVKEQNLTPDNVKSFECKKNKKQAKADKKAKKSASSKKNVVPKFDPRKEEDVERQAAELVARMAAERAHDLEGWKPPTESAASKSDLKTETPEEEPQQKSKETTSTTPPPTETEENEKTPEAEPPESPIAVAEKEVEKSIERVESPPAAERFGWAGFDAGGSQLPTSESDFFAQSADLKVSNAFGDDEKDESAEVDESKPKSDPFAPTISAFDADPFDTRPIDEVIAEAKRRAAEGAEDVENSLLRSDAASGRHSGLSSPTPEGGSPISARPTGFEDDFKVVSSPSISVIDCFQDASYSHTPTPLYDEDDTVELEPFAPQFEGDGWNLMVRHPIKKKSFMSERCWKPCFARLTPDHMLQVFNSKEDRQPILEILLQASYSLSDTVLQAYDAYGKIHTVKLQHVMYKERVGIRAGQISRLVEGHITKYGLPLEHAAQINVLAKFASLDTKIFQSFISAIEDVLFKCPAKRDTTPTYKQDEVQIHCYDEYTAHVDKIGNVSKQRARVRMFCLSFLTGSPYLEIGLNDRRREGKEIVRRKDILPMYTERWIRFEGLEFHNTIDQPVWDEDQVIKLQPPDACFFEVMRFRVRPPRNREKPLTVKSILRMAGSKVEIRIDVMAAAQQQRAKGTVESTRAIPCEDIQIRFPIPEAWIYIFREERTWGVGSVHSKTRRPGKVKNIKDRLMGAVQHTENTLIEVAIGEAKYEHVHRSLVWRIPKLPKDNHQAYKNHLLKCRFQLSSFDLLPENFEPECEIEFTMPLATISNTVVRSVSVEQHEDSDRVEKFVRYVAKCHYDLDIEYLQVSNLDNENDLGVELKKHQTAFNPEEISAQHDGYKIAVDPNRPQPTDDSPPEAVQSSTWNNAPTSQGFETTTGGGFDFDAYARQGNGGTLESTARRDSSSEEEDDDDKSKFPMIQIDMSSYGY